MKKDYINIEGTDYRVEINMNTVEDWEQLSCMKLGQFETEAAQSVLTGGVPTRAVLLWLFCAIREGEDIEGRKFEPDFKTFKRMLRPSTLTVFIPVFLSQYMGTSANSDSTPKPEVKKKKFPNRMWLAFQRFVKSPWARLGLTILIFACCALWYCSTP